MEQLISFQQKLGTLSENEYKQCTTEFVTKLNRKTLSSILFNAFTKDVNGLSMINHLINQIIEARTSKPIDDQSISLKLHHLPSVMLSEIASYLTFNESIHFEKCNRSIFIGCRVSKLPVHTLDGTLFLKFAKFYDHHPFLKNTRIFKSVILNAQYLTTLDRTHLSSTNQLHFNIKHPFSHFNLFRGIQSITIRNCYSNESISALLSHLSHTQNLSAVTALKIIINHNSTRLHGEFATELRHLIDFYNLKLQHLEVLGSPGPLDLQCITSLKGMRIHQLLMNNYGIKTNDADIETISCSLSLESFHDPFYNLTPEMSAKLINLKELCFNCDMNSSSMELLSKQQMKQLRRVHLRNASAPVNKEMPSLLSNIMDTSEYICLNMEDACPTGDLFEYICSNMEDALQLKIRIAEMTLDDDSLDIANHVTRLIVALGSHYTHWMLILSDIYGCPEHLIELNKFIVSIKNNPQYCVRVETREYDCDYRRMKRENKHFVSFVVSNSDCIINGYREPFIMYCEDCVQNPIFKFKKVI
eukprot:147251_1